MRINENIDDFAYYINVKYVKGVPDTGELLDILFDEYAIDGEFYDDDVVKVYAFNDRTINKLVSMLRKYNTPESYIDKILNKEIIKETKNIKKHNMRHSINERRLMKRRLYESMESSYDRCYSAAEKLFNDMMADGFVDFDIDSEEDIAMAIRHHMPECGDRRVMLKAIYDVIRDNHEVSESSVVNMFGDFDPIFEAEDNKPACKCRYNNKLISKMNKAENMAARKEVRKEISELKQQIKDALKDGKSVKALEKKLEKLNNVLDCLMGRCTAEDVHESVTSRFNKNKFLFESEEEEVADDKPEDKVDDISDENPVDDADEAQDDEYEDVDMKALVLTVKKKDVDTVKNAMIEAGVAEDDINFDLDDDAEDDSEVEIRVDVNSIDALKSYLESVGINLEEELGGEIIDDSDDKADDSDNSEEVADADDADDEFDDLFAEK